MEPKAKSGAAVPRIPLALHAGYDYDLRSDHVEIDILVDRHALERGLVERDVEDARLLILRKAPRQVGAELGLEERQALGAAAPVADRIFHHHLVEGGAVREPHRERIGDR